MIKIIEKIKNLFSCKVACKAKKEEESKQQQAEPKTEEESKEQK